MSTFEISELRKQIGKFYWLIAAAVSVGIGVASAAPPAIGFVTANGTVPARFPRQ